MFLLKWDSEMIDLLKGNKKVLIQNSKLFLKKLFKYLIQKRKKSWTTRTPLKIEVQGVCRFQGYVQSLKFFYEWWSRSCIILKKVRWKEIKPNCIELNHLMINLYLKLCIKSFKSNFYQFQSVISWSFLYRNAEI